MIPLCGIQVGKSLGGALMAGGRYDVPMLGGVTAAALIDGVALLGLGGSHGLALYGEVMAQSGDFLALL